MEILRAVKPSYWFSAHLHVKFAALVRHSQQLDSKRHAIDDAVIKKVANPDEVKIDLEDSDSDAPGPAPSQDTRERVNPDQIVIEESEDEDPGCAVQHSDPSHSFTISPCELAAGTDQIMMDQSEVATLNGNPDPALSRPTENAIQQTENSSIARATVSDGHQMSHQSKVTRFLALDKCMPRKDFLQVSCLPPCLSFIRSRLIFRFPSDLDHRHPPRFHY